jgi:hypothetical protein
MSLGHVGDTRLRNSAELARFRAYRLCLDATECCGETRSQKLNSARRSVEQSTKLFGDLSPRKAPLFWSNWLHTDIKRRPPWSLFSWLLRLDHLSSSEVKRHWRRAAREEKERDPEDQTSVSDLAKPEIFEIGQLYGRNSYPRALRLASLCFPSLCTSPLGLPESVVIDILRKCTIEEGPGACYVAFSCAALAGQAALRTLKFHGPIESGMVSTRVCAPQRRKKNVQELLRPSSNLFFRYLPVTLGQQFQHFLHQLGRKRLLKHAQAWLEANWAVHRPTVRKLERALVTNGPLWFGYDWIYAYYSMEGGRRKGHAAKSYCQVSQPIRQRTESYLRAFFDFQLPPAAPNLPSVGSGLVPRDEVIRSLLSRLPEVVVAEIPLTPGALARQLVDPGCVSAFHFLAVLWPPKQSDATSTTKAFEPRR